MDRQENRARPLLRVGQTCWRVERAARAAFLIDAEAYFTAAKAAMRKARQSILILAWDIDPRTRLEPGNPRAAEPDSIGELLESLIAERPELHAHVLAWDMPLPIAIQNPRPRLRPRNERLRGRLQYVLDDDVPPGGCHHQKVLVIDDRLAFCGGMDFAANRWDTPAHADDDPRRRLPGRGRRYEPRHDLMAVVDGAAAAALGELARERWRRATGVPLAPPSATPPTSGDDPWPDGLQPDLADALVGIARTEPARSRRRAVRECEALLLQAIASAARWIYLESQYVASPVIGEAVMARLAEPGGPEVMIVCPARSPSYFDQLSMDPTRDLLIARLRAADAHGRLRVYAPHAPGGTPIIVHSKVTIVDDRFLRIGSANLNNRSMGFDTECDLAVEASPGAAPGDPVREAIRRLLARLLAEHLGVAAETVTGTLARTGGLLATVEALDHGRGRRLRPVSPAPGGVGALIARNHLFDPMGTGDAWRPWKRRGVRPRPRS